MAIARATISRPGVGPHDYSKRERQGASSQERHGYVFLPRPSPSRRLPFTPSSNPPLPQVSKVQEDYSKWERLGASSQERDRLTLSASHFPPLPSPSRRLPFRSSSPGVQGVQGTGCLQQVGTAASVFPSFPLAPLSRSPLFPARPSFPLAPLSPSPLFPPRHYFPLAPLSPSPLFPPRPSFPLAPLSPSPLFPPRPSFPLAPLSPSPLLPPPQVSKVQDDYSKWEVSKVQDDYSKWERLGASSQERETLSKTILADTETLEWELEELDRAIGVAERDPSRFNIEQGEVESRRKWTGSTRDQISMIRSAIQAAAAERVAMQKEAERRELLRVQAGAAAKAAAKSSAGGENESFAASEDDRQALIMREQDDQLDAMSQSLARIGGMGIAIHEELGSQVRRQVVRWSGELTGGQVGSQVVRWDLRWPGGLSGGQVGSQVPPQVHSMGIDIHEELGSQVSCQVARSGE
ncbi:unnamed protein product [Closterium sp. NIES-65]|nr:unnamed protein product [Closterium sp. NIES-65]